MRNKSDNLLLAGCALVLTACGGGGEAGSKTVLNFELPTDPVYISHEQGVKIDNPCVYSAEELKLHFEVPKATKVNVSQEEKICRYHLENFNREDSGPLQNFSARITLMFLYGPVETEEQAEQFAAQTIRGPEKISHSSDPFYHVYWESKGGTMGQKYRQLSAMTAGGTLVAGLSNNSINMGDINKPLSEEFELDWDKFDELVINLARRMKQAP